jgi:hypothetical protein
VRGVHARTALVWAPLAFKARGRGGAAVSAVCPAAQIAPKIMERSELIEHIQEISSRYFVDSTPAQVVAAAHSVRTEPRLV